MAPATAETLYTWLEFIQIVVGPVIDAGVEGTLFTITVIILEVAGEPDKQLAILEPITTVTVLLFESVFVV